MSRTLLGRIVRAVMVVVTLALALAVIGLFVVALS